MQNSELVHRVEDLLNKARPFLAIDGGGVEFIDFEEDKGVLVLKLLGNCADCPLSMMTLRAGIERLILNNISEVKRVEKI
ncbi:MAG TPA: NifU family protein [Candidatus Kapabacteria bacterium]|jgi:Fe-S cluster biogenesis protein NfuA|nr:NifU family protein [Candidatus Kapabacteria bacterium]HOM05236.1 NifU family protein [Candidatus Kapabacteria bacterium]HOQ48354.1 NifU family protein [Candidatus Kapabacteria bacterium]HPU24447.1 NifU family protein [Candidatus Kapabacteria bacterium]